jgi:uncharacterized protein YxeA
MKKVLSTIVAALVAMSFSAVVFAADMPAGHPATGSDAAASDVKKEAKPAKKTKKAKKAKKVEAPKADVATPAAK